LIEQNLARRVLEAALVTGADYSELFAEDTESNMITMTDGKVDDATYSRISGAGVRVLSGTNCAYAYTNDLSEEGLMKVAKAAAAAISGGGGVVAPFTPREYALSCMKPFSAISNDRRIALIKEASSAAKAYSPEITQTSASYRDFDQRILICSSDGVFATDRRPRARIFTEAVASANGEAQVGRESPGFGMGFETFDRIDIEKVGRDAAQIAVTMLHAKECPAGYLPVVIDGGFGGVIFHEACGHSLEATSVSKGNSEFCGKLGQKIASDCVTAIDDGTMPGEWGTLSIDDEGHPTRRNVLIENGILKNYLIDILGGRRMGMTPTGSGRRQNYTYMPTSRMTNTFIAPGKDDPDEMIRGIAEGLYAKRMGGGSVNPLTGEFNFAVLEGYWIKNGEILCPVRGATLVGKGGNVLKTIDRVGPNMWQGQGMCGSASGSIPTNVGQPRIRVSEITIGGKGGAL